MCFICMLLFLVLSLLACCKSSKKNEKTIQTTEKTQVSFAFAIVLLWVLSRTINSDYFSPPTHPYHFKGHPSLSPVPSYSSLERNLGTRLPRPSRGSAIHVFLLSVSMQVLPAEEHHRYVIVTTTVVVCY